MRHTAAAYNAILLLDAASASMGVVEFARSPHFERRRLTSFTVTPQQNQWETGWSRAGAGYAFVNSQGDWYQPWDFCPWATSSNWCSPGTLDCDGSGCALGISTVQFEYLLQDDSSTCNNNFGELSVLDASDTVIWSQSSVTTCGSAFTYVTSPSLSIGGSSTFKFR